MSWEFESLICSVGPAATCGAVVTLAGTPALLHNYVTEGKELKFSRSLNMAVFGGMETLAIFGVLTTNWPWYQYGNLPEPAAHERGHSWTQINPSSAPSHRCLFICKLTASLRVLPDKMAGCMILGSPLLSPGWICLPWGHAPSDLSCRLALVKTYPSLSLWG